MKKKCKIIMLSTNITSNTEVLHIESGGRMIRFNSSISPTSNYHLYIISDDEIKEGDIILTKDYGVWEFRKAPCPLPYWGNTDGCKKIIASTDKLIVGWDYRNDVPNGNDYNEFIPGIPEEFIRLYIEKYNSGHPIEEVEVEYDINGLLGGPVDKYRKDGYFVNRKDNTICISIQSTKDSYTREEVEVLMRKTWRIACSDTDKALLPELEDKFIEETL